MSSVVATCPTRVSRRAQASASSGAAIAASGGRAPCIAQPSASAQPIGTRISATHVSTSAVTGTSAMAPTTTAIDSGATSAQRAAAEALGPARHARRRQRDARRLRRDEDEVVAGEPHARLMLAGAPYAAMCERISASRAPGRCSSSTSTGRDIRGGHPNSGSSIKYRPIRAVDGRELHRRGVHRPQPDVAPGHALLHERGRAHDHGGRDLDRLQDDPVGERVGRADAVGAEHRDARGLEDAEVRRRGRERRR